MSEREMRAKALSRAAEILETKAADCVRYRESISQMDAPGNAAASRADEAACRAGAEALRWEVSHVLGYREATSGAGEVGS